MVPTVISQVDTFFGITAKGSSIRHEILAGLTTFVSICYIIAINPVILMAAGVPFANAYWATIIAAVVGTILMGLYANCPYAVAPFMSQNTLVVYVLCNTLHYPWQAVLGANFLAGLLFSLVILSGFWKVLIRAIPETIGRACTRGIGFFIAFLGTSNSGIIVVGEMLVVSRYIRDIQPANLFILLSGIIVIGILMIRRQSGALICGIMTSVCLAFALGVEKLPSEIIASPPVMPRISDFVSSVDIVGALTPVMLPTVALFFLLTFFDSTATILGLSSLIHSERKWEEIPEIRKAFIANGISSVVSSLVGSTPSGIFIESVAGIEEGGRTGLVAVVVAVLFAISVFFLPVVNAFPSVATAAALLVIGLLMLAQFRLNSLSNREEMLTAFVLIVTMTITQSIGLGLSVGFIAYPIFILAGGKKANIQPFFWVIVLGAALFLFLYPY